ncbi:MAG: TrmB family transcriptional regulator [Nanoarchaeota archaeon]
MNKETLTNIGLSKAESIIYLSLLKLGNSSVKQISKDTGFHRTNIYDVLEQLKEKGLVAFSKQGKILYYKTTDPKNLYNFIEEKKAFLNELMPDLEKLNQMGLEKINVAIFKGKEGMKAVFNDMLREKGKILGMGITGQLREKLPAYAEHFLKTLKLTKREYFGLYDKKEHISPVFTEVRILPKNVSIPVATHIYANKILITIWEPDLIAILIECKEVADTYKSHFNLLWAISKKLN